MENAAQTDLRAVETMGAALEGTGRPLVVTSGTALVGPGTVVTEDDWPDPSAAVHPRSATAVLARDLAGRGVRSSIVRPGPSVHGEGDHGFVPFLVDIARREAFRTTSATARTAGPPFIGSTSHAFIDWRSRTLRHARCSTRSPKACRPETSPRSSAGI